MLGVLGFVFHIAIILLVLWSFIKLFKRYWKIALIVYGVSFILLLLTMVVQKLF